MSATLPDPKKYLGNIPDSDELSRLVDYYEKYGEEHRSVLLTGYFAGKSVAEIVEDKIAAKGIKPPLSKRQRGGHARWVVTKVHRTIVRLLFLRYVLDQKLTKIEANQKLFYQFPSEKAADGGQSNIRKMTRTSKLSD